MGSHDDNQRLVRTAEELAGRARLLVQSTETLSVPSDSYALLAELHATADRLSTVCGQLGVWHEQVVDGREYAGEDARGDGATGTVVAADELARAAATLATAAEALGRAHTANGVVRWHDDADG